VQGIPGPEDGQERSGSAFIDPRSNQMTRKILAASAFLLVLGLAFGSSAQAQQRLNLQLGYFTVRGESARANSGNPPTGTDVLIADLSDTEPLTFNVKDFNGVHVGGEWLVGLGNWLDAGVGVGYYARTVPSFYTNLQDPSGADITQDLRLRIVPITATVRFLPLGHDASIQPYVGAGVGILIWRYSESGQFVDLSDYSIYRASYVGTGTNVGPVVMGGVNIPVGRTFAFGGEIRYQRAEGKLTSYLVNSQTGFLGDRIDLGGLTFQANFQVKFGRR
jgi:outer membrane protein W